MEAFSQERQLLSITARENTPVILLPPWNPANLFMICHDGRRQPDDPDKIKGTELLSFPRNTAALEEAIVLSQAAIENVDEYETLPGYEWLEKSQPHAAWARWLFDDFADEVTYSAHFTGVDSAHTGTSSTGSAYGIFRAGGSNDPRFFDPILAPAKPKNGNMHPWGHRVTSLNRSFFALTAQVFSCELPANGDEFLGLILDDERLVVRRKGREEVVGFSEAPLRWGLLKRLVQAKDTWLDERMAREVWGELGRGDEMKSGTITAEFSRIRSALAPLGVTVQTKRHVGRRLEAMT